MRSTDFFRTEEARRNLETQTLKVADDVLQSFLNMPRDVFEKDDARLNLAKDSSDMWPQVARILFSTTSTGEAERLARISGSEDIHLATPECAVEGSEIRPYRCRIQASFFHLRSQVE